MADVSILISDVSHGNRGGGSLHQVATTNGAGFMSAADKTKLDGLGGGGTGTGDVVGPASAVGDNIATFNLTTGKLIKDSGVAVSAIAGKQAASADLSSIAGLAGTSGFLKKTGASTYALDTNTYLTSLGVGSVTQAWDADLDAFAALAATAGFIKKTGANAYTIDTSTYLTSLGIGSSTQAWDADLDAIAALSTTGFLKRTGTNTWVLDTNTYITANQTITLSGDVSGSGTTAITTAIGANKVTDAMLAQIATATFKGRVTAATGNVETLTGTQATTLLDVFTTSLKGLVPGSGGGTSNFLRADGTWALPPGGGGATWGGITGTLSSQTDLQTALTAKQNQDGDLDAIAALAGTSGILKKTAANTWALQTLVAVADGGTGAGTLTGLVKGNGTSAFTAAVADTDYASPLPAGMTVPFAGISTPTGWLLCDGSSQTRSSFANLFAAISKNSTVTMTIAAPGVITWTAHGLANGSPINLITTGVLPTGLTAGTTYFVVSSAANTFSLALTVGGAAITTSGTQSGVHTAYFVPYGSSSTTTFNLPDLRGRVPAGLDNMGGTAANRLTSAGSGVLGTVLGNAGGAETNTLTTAQLASHTHTYGGSTSGGSTTGSPGVGTGTASTTTAAGSGTAHNNTQPTAIFNYIIKT